MLVKAKLKQFNLGAALIQNGSLGNPCPCVHQGWRGRDVEMTSRSTWARTRSWPSGSSRSGATVRATSSGLLGESSSWGTWRLSPRWSRGSPATAAVWTGCCLSPWSGPTTSSSGAGRTPGNGHRLQDVHYLHSCKIAAPKWRVHVALLWLCGFSLGTLAAGFRLNGD